MEHHKLYNNINFYVTLFKTIITLLVLLLNILLPLNIFLFSIDVMLYIWAFTFNFFDRIIAVKLGNMILWEIGKNDSLSHNSSRAEYQHSTAYNNGYFTGLCNKI